MKGYERKAFVLLVNKQLLLNEPTGCDGLMFWYGGINRIISMRPFLWSLNHFYGAISMVAPIELLTLRKATPNLKEIGSGF
jgi:hypothetical protein